MNAYTEKWMERNAIKHYGKTAQEDKCIEEMAELTQAIIKYRLDPDSTEKKLNLVEEMEDVRIMLEQMVLMHGPIPEVSVKFEGSDRLRMDTCIRFLAELQNAIARDRLGLTNCMTVAITNACLGLELITKIFGRELLIREEKLNRLTSRILKDQIREETQDE